MTTRYSVLVFSIIILLVTLERQSLHRHRITGDECCFVLGRHRGQVSMTLDGLIPLMPCSLLRKGGDLEGQVIKEIIIYFLISFLTNLRPNGWPPWSQKDSSF